MREWENERESHMVKVMTTIVVVVVVVSMPFDRNGFSLHLYTIFCNIGLRDLMSSNITNLLKVSTISTSVDSHIVED